MTYVKRDWIKGVTLLELLVAVSIVALLATVSVPLYSAFKRRAEKAKCITHLRTLHSALVSHVEDKGHWPQVPPEIPSEDWTEDQFFEFWVTSLEPYGASRETWLCPSDKLFLELRESQSQRDKDEYFGSYVPTPFDKMPSTPFRWNQPWVLERGNFHGKGAHMLMPDGSVQSAQNPFYGR